MNKQEFIATLRRELSGISDYEYINDTVSYYENYIESEIRKGGSEEDVLADLGDARLIAKSIRASKAGYRSQTSFKEQFENQDDVKDGAATNTGLTILNKFLNLPVWLRKATGGLAIAGVVILSIALINWLFPVILVGGIAYIFYKFIRDNFMK